MTTIARPSECFVCRNPVEGRKQPDGSTLKCNPDGTEHDCERRDQQTGPALGAEPPDTHANYDPANYEHPSEDPK